MPLVQPPVVAEEIVADATITATMIAILEMEIVALATTIAENRVEILKAHQKGPTINMTTPGVVMPRMNLWMPNAPSRMPHRPATSFLVETSAISGGVAALR